MEAGQEEVFREMVYISRCHRDLFLFLWGFTLVTKLLSGFHPPPPKALKAFIICDGDFFVGKAFFCSDLDLGLRFEILKRSTTLKFWGEKKGKAYDGRVINVSSLLSSQRHPPFSPSCSNHTKGTWGVETSGLHVVGNAGGLSPQHPCFKPHFGTSSQTRPCVL